MRSVIDAWRDDYNHCRPHGALNYLPPAVYAARYRQQASDTAQNLSINLYDSTQGL
jgi:transposase InsO family protein